MVYMRSFSTAPNAPLSMHPILALAKVGLRYKLVAANGAVVLASDSPPRDPVLVDVIMPGTQVRISNRSGQHITTPRTYAYYLLVRLCGQHGP